MTEPVLNIIPPERAKRKEIQLENVDESIECSLYTLMLLKSPFLLKNFVSEWGDSGRKLLIHVKYRLSNCPHTYKMVLDMVQNPDNWEFTPNFDDRRYHFIDKKNDVSFTLFNHSRGIDRGSMYDKERVKWSKYDPKYVKLYFGTQCEMFNDNERLIVAKIVTTHKKMLENLEELKRQQLVIKNSDKLRGMY
jgi:hypothetical protein